MAEFIDQLLAEMKPEKPHHNGFRNIMDEPISQEVKELLLCTFNKEEEQEEQQQHMNLLNGLTHHEFS